MTAALSTTGTRHAAYEIRASANMNDRSCADCKDTLDPLPSLGNEQSCASLTLFCSQEQTFGPAN